MCYRAREIEYINTLSAEQRQVVEKISKMPTGKCDISSGYCPANDMVIEAKKGGIDASLLYVQTDGRACEAPDIAYKMKKLLEEVKQC